MSKKPVILGIESSCDETAAALIRENLDSLAIPYLDTNSHIVAVLINDPFLCKKVSKDLIDDHGIYAQPIFYPTVPKGLERLRICTEKTLKSYCLVSSRPSRFPLDLHFFIKAKNSIGPPPYMLF